MFCPKCSHANTTNAAQCVQCQTNIEYLRERVFIGAQFIFARADDAHPIALQVDDVMQTYHAPMILSRHQHNIAFGDEYPKGKATFTPLPIQAKLTPPILTLFTVVTDRKIYKPDADATVFIVAPAAGNGEVSLEIQLSNQKVYETKVPLHDGFALHRYADLKEGEYRVVARLPYAVRQGQAECEFSVAQFTLSPLIATLEKHEYAERRLKFTLKLTALSVPYEGEVEFGLQCGVCGDRIVDTQTTKAKNGVAHGDFDIGGHGGPFKVQLTTPDGNTALVDFPGTGAQEREHIRINSLGNTAEMGLLPWENAEPVRGFFVGASEVSMTPFMLENVIASHGKLRLAADVSHAQVITSSSHRSERIGPIQKRHDYTNLTRGSTVEFDADAPYTFFTVGAFVKDKPFEGWGIVIKPVTFEATLTAPQTAKPSDEIAIEISVGSGVQLLTQQSAVCWLLAYDARLEHESPMPKLAKLTYESVRDATRPLATGDVASGMDERWKVPDTGTLAGGAPDLMMRRLALRGLSAPATSPSPTSVMGLASKPRSPMAPMKRAAPREAAEVSGAMAEMSVMQTMTIAPTRMEFPELVYNELFELRGKAERTIKLGDQIGTWRVRAYVFQGVDYCELTADVQADKPLYAELDVPALASEGDEVMASVNYVTRTPAELVIATRNSEQRVKVNGNGMERFAITGPGRVEVRIKNEESEDWSVRDVAPPGRQKVMVSQLKWLSNGESAQGERVVVYANVGQVLKDTIEALIQYPFG
jgi:hypothetical protein